MTDPLPPASGPNANPADEAADASAPTPPDGDRTASDDAAAESEAHPS